MININYEPDYFVTKQGDVLLISRKLVMFSAKSD